MHGWIYRNIRSSVSTKYNKLQIKANKWWIYIKWVVYIIMFWNIWYFCYFFYFFFAGYGYSKTRKSKAKWLFVVFMAIPRKRYQLIADCNINADSFVFLLFFMIKIEYSLLPHNLNELNLDFSEQSNNHLPFLERKKTFGDG